MRSWWQNKTSQKNSGFTLVEVMVVAPILILMIGGLITVIVTLTGEALVSRAKNQLIYDINNTLSMIENDAKLSTSFLATSGSVQTPQGFDNNTTGFNNVDTSKGDMLILNIPLTTSNPLSADRNLIYLANEPNPCGGDVTQNTIMTGKVIYFVKDNKLWRRTILPTGYNTAGFSCATPWQLPSCATSSTRGTYCKTDDILLAYNVSTSDFKVKYFNSPSSTTPDSIASNTANTATTRQTALNSMTTLEIELTGSQSPAGRDISTTQSVRVDKLN